MGTELVRTCIKEENMDIPSIPPGFESLAPFILKKVEDKEIKMSHSASASGSESQTTCMEIEFEYSKEGKIANTLRRRPWINYCHSSGDESDSEQVLFLNLFSTAYYLCAYLNIGCYLVCISTFHVIVLFLMVNLQLQKLLKSGLPKGVIRGCDDCVNCQKVSFLT